VLVRRGFHVIYIPEENLAKTSMTRQTLLQVTGYSLAASLGIKITSSRFLLKFYHISIQGVNLISNAGALKSVLVKQVFLHSLNYFVAMEGSRSCSIMKKSRVARFQTM